MSVFLQTEKKNVKSLSFDGETEISATASLQGEANQFQPRLFPLHDNRSLGVLITFLYEVVMAVNRGLGEGMAALVH